MESVSPPHSLSPQISPALFGSKQAERRNFSSLDHRYRKILVVFYPPINEASVSENVDQSHMLHEYIYV